MNTKLLLVASMVTTTIVSCSSPTEESAPSAMEMNADEMQQSETIPEAIPQIDPAATTPTIDTVFSEETMVYNGSWFTINYPKGFTAFPIEPMETWGDNYEHVVTDEASFTSKDGQVTFFVYSPQWGGEPKDYLEVKANEEITSEQTQTSGDENWPITDKWVTLTDIKADYMRAYHSRKTESTHLVFGIQYTTQEAYDRYKPLYLAFKESLAQYAD